MKFAVGSLLLLFSLLLNFGILCYGFNLNRVLNGFPADANKFKNIPRIHPLLLVDFQNPFNASILVNLCTGSIISDRHILTAAHCAYGLGNISLPYQIYMIDYLPINPNDIVMHEFNISDHGLSTNAYAHKGFHFQHFQDDIAIIEFPVGSKLGEPVKLAKNYVVGDKHVGINVGYGDSDPSTEIINSAEALMQINQPIWADKDCKAYKKEQPVICAGNFTHRSGSGDSGGPFFIQTDKNELYQIGITHAGAYLNGSGVDDEKYPDMTTFLRVSAYCDWIESTTKGDAKCENIVGNIVLPTPDPNAPTDAPVQPENPSDAPLQGSTEAQVGGNGEAMSKNIFLILFSFILAYIL